MIDEYGSVKLQMDFQKLFSEAFKTVHGERKTVEQTNVNIDIDLMKVYDEWKKKKKKITKSS